MSKLTRIAFLTLGIALILTLMKPEEAPVSTDDVVLSVETEIPVGKVVLLSIENQGEQTIQFDSNCPYNPLAIEKYVNGEWLPIEVKSPEANCAQEETIKIAPKENYQVNYAAWNEALFGELGRYRISLNTTLDGKEKVYSKEIEIEKRGLFRTIGQEVFYKPILNTLVFFISVLPGHNLGLAIIILTLIIKLILLLPSQKALKAQKAMQKIQPQLDALKKKYQNDPQKLTAETMEIWKKHKVNPMSSCLPLLIQFPILIALFYVIKDGIGSINPQLLYSGLKGFDTTSINPHFLSLELTEINRTFLPVIIGGLQFIQMKLSMGQNMKKNENKDNPMSGMNKVMVYFMPLMIAFFTATFPAGVALYWGTSTLFGIGQQLVVNRSK